jgi:NAD(P)-dependent dehydrogenase (short-subunit alcohol dehydrogenase family)
LRLAKHNPSAIFLCSRDAAKGENAIKEIEAIHPSGRIKLLELDLASLKSISKAAESFTSQSNRLDLLINNAGVMGVEGVTEDGYEIQLGTNHLGHALFTKLLLPTMLKTAEQKDADVRIVNLSSGAHSRCPAPGFTTEDLELKNVGPMARYSRSKLANILFARQMAKRYPQITSVAIHPGVIKTDLFNSMFTSNRIVGTLSNTFGWAVYKTVEEGAKNSLWTATAPKTQVKSGQYYLPIGVLNEGSAYSRDEKMAESLWDWTQAELKKHGF